MQFSTWELILHASFLVKVVLLLLFGFSIMSCGLIVNTWFSFTGASRECAAFLKAFASAHALGRDGDGPLSAGPMGRVFSAGRQAAASNGRIEPALRKAVQLEAERFESPLVFLASMGSAAPFIGLLGTVWGIMDAFRAIGASGSASLAVLSPAIAEALITTAAGLLVAIPAVMAYNGFLHWGRKLSQQLEDVAEEVERRLAGEGSDAQRVGARTRV